MNTNEPDRDESVLASLLELEDERPSNRHHFVCEPDELESRQLLSAVQATTSSQTSAPQVVGATAGVGETAGFAGPAGTGSTVVTQTTGGIDYLQSQVPINDLLANLSQVTANVYETPSPITVSNGLLSLPITPLLAPRITGLETPLNNGTNEEGTVWITPPPLPPGLFHLGSTLLPFNTNTMMQMPNPQWGPPTLTHFGQAANGSLNGTAVEEPIATGPVGPMITEEIEPVQPPPVQAHQPFGPPAQLQQDETAPQQNGMTPPSGEEGAGENGTPGQGVAPGQSGGSAAQGHQRGAGGETTQGIESTTPNVPASPGAQTQSAGNSGQVGPQGNAGAQQGGSANPAEPGGGSQGGGRSSRGSDGSVYWIDPERLHPDRRADPDADVIDAAITSLADNGENLPPDAEGDNTLSTAFGAAAVAVNGLRMALRDPARVRSGIEAGPGSQVDPSRDPRREPAGV
ncbi:MAG: hypothetical protein ACYC61_22160 [Isosphaeraceae bacterium]